jgi:hypothetical protein
MFADVSRTPLEIVCSILDMYVNKYTRAKLKRRKEYQRVKHNQTCRYKLPRCKKVRYTNRSGNTTHACGRPKQRGGSKDIVFSLTNAAGFGSTVNFLTQAYIQAKKNDVNFAIENNGWHYGDWHDYFNSLKKLDPSIQNVTRYKHASDIPESTFQEHHDAIKDIFVLNDDLKKSAEDFKNMMGRPYKAIYVRRGDKTSGLEKEMSPQDIPALIKETDISAGDKLFVMSDDYAVVEEVKKLLPEVNVFTMATPESRGSSIHELKKLDPVKMKIHAKELFTSMEVLKGASKSWVDNRSNLGRFMKLSTPITTILYPFESSNKDIPMTATVDPGRKMLL